MNKTVLLVLVLSGLPTLSSRVFREFHYINTLMTWTEAQTYCRQKFDDLASIYNQGENDRLQEALQDPGVFAWIGLKDNLMSWWWTLGGRLNNVRQFKNWKSNEPVTKPHGYTCTLMRADGLWYSSICGEKHPAVCYDEQDPRKYIVVKSSMTWHNARVYCQTNHTNLASARNMTQNNNISSLLSVNTWFGLSRKNWEFWSTKKHRNFHNWNKDQPDNLGDTVGSCAVVNATTGKWWDENCTAKHYFICEKIPVQHKLKIKLMFRSKTDLSDPAVQQQIIEQLHAKMFNLVNLTNHEANPHLKLSWMERYGQTFRKGRKRKKEVEPDDPLYCEGRPGVPTN